MNFRQSLESFLDALGLIGFTVRGDKRKDAWKKLDARVWGPDTAGFELSIQVRPAVANPGDPVHLALALRNASNADVRATITDWLAFYQVTIMGPDGKPLETTEYEKRLLAVHPDARQSVLFPANTAVHNELPISDLYDMSSPGKYQVKAHCQAPGSAPETYCVSNEEEVTRVG